MSETSQASDDNNIKIYLRIKPKLANDSKNEEANYIKISEDKKCLSLNLSPENESKFYFDNKYYFENNKIMKKKANQVFLK